MQTNSFNHMRKPEFASRVADIETFYAVEVYREAMAMAASREVILMCIGEPDFPTPSRVIEAAYRSSQRGETHYTMPLGIPELRRAIAASYRLDYGLEVDSERIVVTVGGSGALLMTLGALVQEGDEIITADPGYPSNRACLTFCGATARLVPVGEAEQFQLTADLVALNWTPKSRGVLLGTPSNPTGTSINPQELKAIHEFVAARGGVLIVDEIYHKLIYGDLPKSAVELGDNVVVINSFSKYHCMTGWRVGWIVAPHEYVPAIEKLQGHFFICPPAPSQWAAVAALEPESTAIYESQRKELQQRRNFLVPALRALGLRVPVEPDGAFYVYADVSAKARSSWDFAFDLLRTTGVAVTPGRDFGRHRADEFVRISYTASRQELEEGVRQIAAYLKR